MTERVRSRYLATFSGRYGDILWSLPTVKELSRVMGEPFDFCTMGIYNSLAPLIEDQPYIKNSGWSDNWKLEHECYGSQPWQPPQELEQGYEKVWHLTYRSHPQGIGLMEFIAQQQGLQLTDPFPFLTVHELPLMWAQPETQDWSRTVAYSFNTQYDTTKQYFLTVLMQNCINFKFIDVQNLEWRDAAYVIKKAMCFVGCHSSNNVIAHGVGQKHIFIFEPHPSRHAEGPLGIVFSRPTEITTQLHLFPQVAADRAAEVLQGWYQSQEQETSHEVTAS